MKLCVRVLGVALLSLAAARSMLATELLVPYAVRVVDRGVVERTELLITNTQPSLTQSITLRWRASDGGRGRVRTIELAPGESRLVDGLVPPGRRGLVALDAAPGMAVSARLVTDRPGWGRDTVPLPVLNAASAAKPSTRLVLQNLEDVPGESSSSISVLNLSSRFADCSATLRGADGGSAVTVTFTVDGRDQRLLDDIFSLYGAEPPVRAVAEVSCNREFWALGMVAREAEGGQLIVEPAFDAVGVPTSHHSLTGSPSNSTFFRLPGQYLQSNSGNLNWQYDMWFDSAQTFTKVKLDFDVYVAGWDSNTSQYFHCLFWLNQGTRWSNMMGYLNALGSRGQTRLEVNSPTYIRQSSGGSVWPGDTFHVHYEMDFIEGLIWYRISKGGETVIEKWFDTTASSFTTTYMRIQFGSQYTTEGPEANTYGWKFSNFVAEYVP